MKYSLYSLYIIQIIFFVLISNSKQEVLEPYSYTSTPKKITTGSWTDLLSYQIQCENSGVLKNFVLKKNSTHFWYEYQCYASKKSSNPDGEPIIKNLVWVYLDKTNKKYSTDISSLNNIKTKCFVDYGMKGFQIYTEKDKLVTKAICVRVKPSYVSTLSKKTDSRSANSKSIDTLVNTFVGRKDKETETDIAFALRGFQYKVDTSSSSSTPTVSLVYSYSKIRNMKALKQSYAKKFEELRKKNVEI